MLVKSDIVTSVTWQCFPLWKTHLR